MLWAFGTFFKKIIQAKGLEKKQIKYVGIGLFASLGLGAIFDVLFPLFGNMNYVMFSSFYLMPFLVMTSFAILRHRLLDIEVVIKRTTLYLILVAIIIGLYSFILMLPQRFIGPPGSPGSVGLMIAAAIVIALTVQPLRDWLDVVTDRLFFQKKYDYYRVLEKVALELNSVINLQDALNVVAHPLIDEVHLKSVGFYLREKGGEAHYICRKKAGPDSEPLPEYVEEENPAIQYLLKNNEILEAGEFRHKFGHLYSGDKILDPQKARIQEVLDLTFRAGLLIPLVLKQNLIGFAVLGEKRSGDQFTQRDLALLEVMAGQMAVTLENIKMYEQMLNNERLTIIGTMSAGIAHEIRNPLASIKAFIQMLPMKYHKPVFRKRFDEIIPSEIDRISGITENLLAFSKPSPLKLEQVFIRNVVDRVIMLLSNQLRKSAIQASNPGGKIKVVAEERQRSRPIPDGSDSHILVSVIDEGAGIKKMNLSNIFQPFFTTKNEGTGLGLPTCKRIIEAHHGGIRVESAEGKGARFIVRLPVNLILEAV
jgi:signal transduction histidine kinase